MPRTVRAGVGGPRRWTAEENESTTRLHSGGLIMPRRRGTYRMSKRFRELRKNVDENKSYPLREALAVLKRGPHCKFDETVELAVKLDIDTKQADQMVRGSFSLPKGTGRNVRVICFAEGKAAEEAKAAGALEVGGEELAKRIQGGWFDFDVVVAHPATMRFVGRLGRLLGPKGLMPTPKAGTVTPETARAVREFRGGKVSYRNDSFGNIHVPVGKLSFADSDLEANIRAMYEHLLAIRPAAVKGRYVRKASVSCTMGPGLAVVV